MDMDPTYQPQPAMKKNKTWLWILILILGVLISGAGAFFFQQWRLQKLIVDENTQATQAREESESLKKENAEQADQIKELEKKLEEQEEAMKKLQEQVEKSNATVSYVSDPVLNMTFDYPLVLGEITVKPMKEVAASVKEKKETITAQQLFFAGDKLFFVANNPNVKTSDRGGYWGDASRGIKSEEDLKKYCDGKQNCKTFTNKFGFTVVKETKELCEPGTPCGPLPQYLMFNKFSAFSSITIAPVNVTKDTTLENFEKMVLSVNFFATGDHD